MSSVPEELRSIPAVRLIAKFEGRLASLDELLDFAATNLTEPIAKLLDYYHVPESFHLLDPSHGRRPADWRWQLALLQLYCLTKGLNRRAVPDAEPVLRLLIAIACGAKQTKVLATCGVSIAAIDALAVRTDPNKSGLTVALEARILAGTDRTAIAQSMGITVEAVAFYETAYFDVRDRLSQQSFIVIAVIENRPPSEAVDRELLRMSYAGGPQVAECLLLGFDPTVKKPQTQAEVEAFLHADIRSTLYRKAALAIRLLDEFCPKVGLRLLKLFNWLAIQERRFGPSAVEAKGQAERADAFRKIVAPMFSGKPALEVD